MDAPARKARPQAVLFSCGQNAVRSPMAAGLFRELFGKRIYVASAGVQKGELDPFVVAVMAELGIDISRHKPHTFEELDDLEGLNFDLIVTLSPPAHHKALELTRTLAADVEYWPTPDPTAIEGIREQKLEAYRAVRDELMRHIRERFGSLAPHVVQLAQPPQCPELAGAEGENGDHETRGDDDPRPAEPAVAGEKPLDDLVGQEPDRQRNEQPARCPGEAGRPTRLARRRERLGRRFIRAAEIGLRNVHRLGRECRRAPGFLPTRRWRRGRHGSCERVGHLSQSPMRKSSARSSRICGRTALPSVSCSSWPGGWTACWKPRWAASAAPR